MKLFLINFMLFLLELYKNDLDDLNFFGKFVLYPFWVLRNLYLTMVLPLIVVYYFIMKSRLYNEVENIVNEIDYTVRYT